jgi:glucokinase
VTPVLSFDVGGTQLRAALIDKEGKILASRKTSSGRMAPESLAEASADLGKSLEAEVGVQADCIGVAIAGMVSQPRQMVEVAPNLGWRRIPFRDLMQQACGMRPVRLVNDLAAAAAGEAHRGAGQGADPVLCVFVGTGVGSALVTGGSPFPGFRGVAGEMGHIKVRDAQGRACGCGARGCLEAYVGGRHLLEQVQAASDAGDAPEIKARLDAGDALSMSLVDSLAADETSFCARLLRQSAQLLGTALANSITLMNPRVVVLGGGVLSHSPRLRSSVEDVAIARANPPALQGCEIKDAALGDDAGLIGASFLAQEHTG